jgi:hypothetical protein
MRKFIGVGIIVLGIIMVIAGLEASDSLASRFSRLFTGSPTDRTLWYFILGVVGLAVGASMVWPRRRPTT